MSNLPGSEVVTFLKALPVALRSKVIKTVSSPAPDRNAMYRPSGEIDTPCICGRRAKLSMGWFAAKADTENAEAQNKTVATATRAERIIDESPF